MGTKGRNEFGDPIFDVTAYYVRKTNNYKKFRFVDGNRDVARTGRIRNSIKENGWYRQPILVNEHFEIIEGQHRFVVCKELGLPIEYVVQEGLEVKDCVPLNVSRKNWSVADYVHLNATSIDDYKYFELMMQRFGFPPRTVYAAMGRSVQGNHVEHFIKAGTLTCTVEEYNAASSILQWLSQFKEDIRENDLRGRKDNLFLALIFAHNSRSISVDALTERVHRNFSKYGKAIATIDDAVEMILNGRTEHL